VGLLCKELVYSNPILKHPFQPRALETYIEAVEALDEICSFRSSNTLNIYGRHCNTVCKFQNFSVSHILLEINFGDYRSAKSAVFAIFGALNFVNLVFFSFQKLQKFMKIRIQSL